MSYRNVAQAFNQGAKNYEQEAIVQKIVAKKLTDILQNYPAPKSILEIGCGTGFLTELVYPQFLSNSYYATDIALSMVQQCKSKFTSLEHLSFCVVDGEQLPFNHKFDWIISSLSFQWFKNIDQSIQHLWQQTNMLAFTLLIHGSFQEWEELCKEQKVENKFIQFPNENIFKDICLKLKPTSFHYEIETETQIFNSFLDFIRSLKRIGASYSSKDSTSSSLIKFFRHPQENFSISYRVAYCILQR